MWTMYVDVKAAIIGRTIMVLDDGDQIMHQGPSLFKALAYIHEHGPHQFEIEGGAGLATVTINSLKNDSILHHEQTAALPPGVEWAERG